MDIRTQGKIIKDFQKQKAKKAQQEKKLGQSKTRKQKKDIEESPFEVCEEADKDIGSPKNKNLNSS